MKIDRRRPNHWLYLLGFFVQGVIGVLCRKKKHQNGGRKIVLLYGHKLNGNLLALYRAMRRDHEDRFRPIFLTMDLAYHRQLRAAGEDSVWAAGRVCSRVLAEADAVVSDHGLHALQPLHDLYRKRDVRFFDVWHGIPFKGFDAHDFRLQRRYDEIWVASHLHRRLYVERYEFEAAKVIATGYARTDQLVNQAENSGAIRHRLGLPARGRLVLFAPTWAQDARGRSIYPFGVGAQPFLQALSAIAEKHEATIILRSHLNSGAVNTAATPRIVPLSGSEYPDAEEILRVSDLLICDWSSIAFDFLLLDRPALFLDVPAPFAKGFSLGSEYRFGPVPGSLAQLTTELDRALADYEGYRLAGSQSRETMRARIYGAVADGQAADRCVRRLQAALISS